MLTCITCSKQRADDGEEAPRGTPSTKDAVKSITNQIKDMALKASGSSKPSKGESSYNRGYRAYPDFDMISEGQYPSSMQRPSSSSTAAWDFGHRDSRADSRFSHAFAGDQTPDARESISTKYGEVVLENDTEPKEWMAQVEPGVQITFVSLPRGGNDLKRIRFSREMFNKWEAQRWWGENYDRIMELYNVQKFNQQPFNTPGRDSTYSRLDSAQESPRMTPSVRYRPSFPPDHGSHYYNAGSSAYPGGASRGETSYMEASRATNASVDEPSVSISNASDIESEWIEEDEPGVYITIRQLVDGTRELRRVRFSREKFGEVNAKNWWEINRDRIQNQYL